MTRYPRQLSLFPVAVPLAAGPTLEQLRHMLHVSQIMRLNTARPARQRYELERLEVWLRAMIRLDREWSNGAR